MPQDLTITSPASFGLKSFADLLPARDPIVGEDPGSFTGFHGAIMSSLFPATPYECVIAENLIAIEWELAQQRRMRDAGLRGVIRKAITRALVDQRNAEHDAVLDEDFEKHVEEGGDEDNWQTRAFDRGAAMYEGEALANRAMSPDPEVQATAYEEVLGLGMDPVEIMGGAYRSHDDAVTHHDRKVRELEGRRREVKRDYDALQRARPLEAKVIEH